LHGANNARSPLPTIAAFRRVMLGAFVALIILILYRGIWL